MSIFKRAFGKKHKKDEEEIIYTRENTENEHTLHLASPNKEHLLVAAIDLGTTFSGWAFSFYSDFKNDPTKAHVKEWNSGTSITEKTPTNILINPDGKTIKSFGYDAQNEYRELINQNENENFYYFEKFKMMLNKKIGEKLDRTITLEDTMGRSLPALDVFSLSIKFLMDDMMKVVGQRLSGKLNKEEILWVITVPAIWTDGAKQFMREAAVMAGINTEKVLVALEPEAASIFCRHLPVDMNVAKSKVSISRFPVGTKYIVLDAGGGTIDITVHEIVPDGVKEIEAASGGGWGGTMVDKAFETFLKDIFGENVYSKFKKEETEDWLDIWRDFEVKKRNVSTEKTSNINMKFPLSLINMSQESNQRSLQKTIESSKFAKDISLKGDKMAFSPDLFRCFFEESINNIIEHLFGLIGGTSAKAMLVVGGYADSPMLQLALQTTFKDLCLIIPQNASSTILRGAIIYGHSPNLIKERVLKYTYGVRTTAEFIRGYHDINKLFYLDGRELCNDLFCKYVEREEQVQVGVTTVTKTLYTSHDKQKEGSVSLYASLSKSPMYIDDDGCTLIGEMVVPLKVSGRHRSKKVEVSLTFSGTEIQVEATDVSTGKRTNASLNFLG